MSFASDWVESRVPTECNDWSGRMLLSGQGCTNLILQGLATMRGLFFILSESREAKETRICRTNPIPGPLLLYG